MAHVYYSQGAFRYGDYVAKFAVVPVAPEQLAAGKQKVPERPTRGASRLGP
ncbi:MAG: hypothetical protein WKF47_05775 [Geodermatophilaceae bacterium]